MLQVLSSAFRQPWEQRGPLVRAIIAPLLVVLMVGLIGEFGRLTFPESLDWLWFLLYFVPAAWLAVCVHRFFQREFPDTRAGLESGNLKRVTLYIALVGAFCALFVGMALAASFIGLAVVGTHPEDGESSLAQLLGGTSLTLGLTAFFAVILSLIGGRLCLALPAVAMSDDIGRAVRAARGNTLRLAVIFAVLPIASTVLVELLFRDEATLVEAGLLVMLGTIFMVVEVTALSLSYRELRPPELPPTNPRA